MVRKGGEVHSERQDIGQPYERTHCSQEVTWEHKTGMLPRCTRALNQTSKGGTENENDNTAKAYKPDCVWVFELGSVCPCRCRGRLECHHCPRRLAPDAFLHRNAARASPELRAGAGTLAGRRDPFHPAEHL